MQSTDTPLSKGIYYLQVKYVLYDVVSLEKRIGETSSSLKEQITEH